jgi:hypothetical protein
MSHSASIVQWLRGVGSLVAITKRIGTSGMGTKIFNLGFIK